MYRHDVELFKEPLEIRKKLSTSYGTEMSEWELAFLCGLIKQYKPKKIVEIGVAAGGTTAIILNCISLLKMNTEVHSIDLSVQCYRSGKQKTGYLAEEAKIVLHTDIHHELHLGMISPQILKDIGENIDFLILDTVHSLPGELLDFLACYPFLKKGAIVVLHDILLNQRNKNDSYATKLLFDTVAAEKITGSCNEQTCLTHNIGAFQVTEDTGTYIENVFSALSINWNYMPDNDHLRQYRDFYEGFYDDEKIGMFDTSLELNRALVEKKNKEKVEEFLSLKKIVEQLEDKKDIYIYGCGYYGKKLYDLLNKMNIIVDGFVISDGHNILEHMDTKVLQASDLFGRKRNCTVVLGISSYKQEEIEEVLKDKGCTSIIRPDKHVFKFLNG